MEASLTAAIAGIDLGGTIVQTWAYSGLLPGPELGATVGDRLRVTLQNQLPEETDLQAGGLATTIEDGGTSAPQRKATPVEGTRAYQVLAHRPGVFLLRSSTGTQADRGLYAPLVIQDPNEPGRYDDEWLIVLDDWIDDTGRTPDDALAALRAGARKRTTPARASTAKAPFGYAGDLDYSWYLINGAPPDAPATYRGRQGQRLRLRIINAAADTIFTIAIANHRLTVTHADGFPVTPRTVGALHVGMGETFDAVLTLGDGVFPLVARAWNQPGRALALLRTAAGEAPTADKAIAKLRGSTIQGSDLRPAETPSGPWRPADRQVQLRLYGHATPYSWAMNEASSGLNGEIALPAGQRIDVELVNLTQAAHPICSPGHTFTLPNGLRKDTVLVPPLGSVPVVIEATRDGISSIRCQNPYHAAVGMTIALRCE